MVWFIGYDTRGIDKEKKLAWLAEINENLCRPADGGNAGIGICVGVAVFAGVVDTVVVAQRYRNFAGSHRLVFGYQSTL